MNPLVLNHQWTKTIEYLNERHELQNQNSESLTEKHHEQEMPRNRKKNNNKKMQPQLYIDTKPNASRTVIIETLDQLPNQRQVNRNLPNPPKSKHKKGKSMEIEQLKALSKEEKRHYIDNSDLEEEERKIIINNHFLNGFRERESISEMKQYNFSKKLGVVKKNKHENIALNTRNKSRQINEGQIKQIKKQIKQMIEATPLQLNYKKKELSNKSSSKSSKSNCNNLSMKGGKHYSKSHEIATERKVKSSHKQKTKSGLSELKNIAHTMPITSKMVSLYSNTSSVFSSKSSLQKVNRRHSYVIPTEESMEEMPEIRQYESLCLRKRSCDNLRKVSLINQLSQETPIQSTQKIITHYLELLKLNEPQFQRHVLSNDFELSQIHNQNSLRERISEINSEVMLASLNLGDIRELPKDTSVLLEKSEVVHHFGKEIEQQQRELSKLNEIIDIIHRKEKNQKTIDKQQILLQIKSLLGKNYQSASKPQQQQASQQLERSQLGENDPSKHELSSNELNSSINLEESVQGLNLQILDKTLRERENYLIGQKERQLGRLQEQNLKNEQWVRQKEKIEKWMDHQIKEVAHIRRQLWKGFNIAKNILIASNPKKDSKKNEMIKCLSDKYLGKSFKKSKKKGTEGLSRDTQGLSRGRVNNLDSNLDLKHSEHSSDMDIEVKSDSESDSAGQVMQQTSANLQNQLIQHINKQANENCIDFSNEISSESVQSSQNHKPFEESPSLVEPPSLGVPSIGGLILQKIECEIDEEDSLNEEQIQALSKESQKAKVQSLRIPYELTIEDKQDIYEFIFLDLCIELTEEYAAGSAVMKKISSFIKSMKEQAKKQKGFKTNTNAIRDYLFQFITFLKNKPTQLEEVHLNIDKPLGPTALDILKYMHVYDDPLEEEDNTETVFIMDIKLFQSFEQTYLNALQFQKYYDDEEKEIKRKIFLKNAIHIHNKAIFDALNETLDRQRPFGVWGQPFSWKKAAKFYHSRDVASKNNVILKSAQKTIEFGAYMCGFIADKEDCNLKNNPNVTQSYIDQIRDDRLSRLLANELDESEEKMLFIDDEQTEILVQVAQAVLQNLLVELCKDLSFT